jgi:hypothetical protein
MPDSRPYFTFKGNQRKDWLHNEGYVVNDGIPGTVHPTYQELARMALLHVN